MRITHHGFFLIFVGLTALAACRQQRGGDEPALPQGVHWDETSGVLSMRRGRRTCTMRFVRVKAGRFSMGGADCPRTILAEGPPRRVRIPRDFWIGATEVTREQWYAFSGESAPDLKERSNPSLPMTRVSWTQIQGFVKRISQSSGAAFRLPTEAEWEYACRAGSRTCWSWTGGSRKLRGFGWYRANSGGHLQPVATLQPNPWGLFDMHGNAVEWVGDSAGPAERILRGGQVGSDAGGTSCTCRYQYPAAYGYQFAGFRLAAEP